MREFKVGDRVLYNYRGSQYEAVVTDIDEDDCYMPYLVRIDDIRAGIAHELPQWVEVTGVSFLSPGVNYKLIKTEFLQGVEL